MSEEAAALQAGGTEGVDSDLLVGLQAIAGARESGWEFSPTNLPDLIEKNKKIIRQAIDDELPKWQFML